MGWIRVCAFVCIYGYLCCSVCVGGGRGDREDVYVRFSVAVFERIDVGVGVMMCGA